MHNLLDKTTYSTEPNLTTDRKKMFEPKRKLYPLLSLCLLSISTSAYAATDTPAYVDSVHGWGAWELGLEPAAGGTPPSPSRALTSRDANVQFRPNDNSAFSPDSRAVAVTSALPTPMPVAPPSIPATTPITQPATPGQIPTGSPLDRFR